MWVSMSAADNEETIVVPKKNPITMATMNINRSAVLLGIVPIVLKVI
eukprot:CAMPEP_0198561616 /NCGR_PEP_ID=MMETSP1462-20131121/95767_1 /TAXON_ID=1333877 /ORGANISM="Brandtodinium nutriculum, Strain RCC3387" /LENGTH=46 /DNA_ID= /DNA_START= /DNA_END= /DNA_ORIENTATION=